MSEHISTCEVDWPSKKICSAADSAVQAEGPVPCPLCLISFDPRAMQTSCEWV